ncbi:AAA family ATPase [Solirubrobacter ginsenosidimutans]|uniref:AAA family ATPase n=1 Tax=Solirubrobacter ginsenosidimutans TaxID=490573 RepID=A0A9X3N2L8_9ACTN|nr:AAA family ATPase [Solirubrobacter ginsenosidimutans]MDA0165903.1 AAA family ATPase [Solirubrobacter ginsenosidimutans]
MQGILDLLEREEELLALDAALANARAGQGQVLAVEGPGGIGKTRLLAATRAAAREAGMRTLHARASELERSFTFGVVRQLFEPALFAAAEEERDRWLSGAAGLTRSMFDAAGAGLDESSYARLHGLYWLCANLAADGSLLVCVDDAQWADEPSLSFLGFLARRLEDLPVALVLGTRPRAEQESEVLRGLVTDPGTRVLRPPALTGAAVGQWVRSAIDPAAGAGFCEACHETTGGNPFLVRELLHDVLDKQLSATDAEAAAVRELGPEAISTVVLQRLHRLPPTAPEMARAVALLGEGANPTLAAELAGLDAPTAEEALEALCRADVLTRDGDRLAFVHPIVLSAIYHDLPVRARTEGHGRAARLLHTRGGAPEEVASQLALTAPRGDEWVVEALRLAAARAFSLGDPLAAAAHLRRALAEPPADLATVYSELANAEGRAGVPAAAESYREAMRLAEGPQARAGAALGLARCLKLAGDSPAAIAVLKSALTELSDADADLAEALHIEVISSAYISLVARPLVAAELAEISAPAVARTPLDRLHLIACAVEGVIQGHPAERYADLARRGLSGAESTTEGHVLITGATALQFAERFDEAERLYSRAVDETRRLGAYARLAAASSARALLLYRLGRLSAAEADAVAALDLRSVVHGTQGYLALALNAFVFASLDRGTAGPEMLSVADDFVATQRSDDLPFSHALYARGWLRAELGDLEGGLAELLACGARELEMGVGSPQIIAWRSAAAEVCLRLGRLEQARELAGAEVVLARAIGMPRAIGVALRAAALAETGTRRLSLLRETVAVLETSRGALELARARIDLGAALLRSGKRDEAREHLRDGQEGAAAAGATPLVERAHRELVASGARPRRTAAAGRDGLTPSELRVAEMAAGGQTNREIAQALFVTEKTVETHLGRAFMKLGVRSRKHLAQALDQAPAEVA